MQPNIQVKTNSCHFLQERINAFSSETT